MIILGIVLAAVLILAAVVLVRAMNFKPQEEVRQETAPVTMNKEKIINDMADMIRCKTVSYRDAALRNKYFSQ